MLMKCHQNCLFPVTAYGVEKQIITLLFLKKKPLFPDCSLIPIFVGVYLDLTEKYVVSPNDLHFFHCDHVILHLTLISITASSSPT